MRLRLPPFRFLPLLAAAPLISGCFATLPSSGGGQTDFDGARAPDPADVALPAGYRAEVVARGLTFPTGVAFDPAGGVYVLEAGYSYGEAWTVARLVAVEADGTLREVARGENPPWNGVAFHDGAFFVAEGGQREGGRILRIDPGGGVRALVEGLPSLGDHHTNGPAVGPDGWIYFGQGTATNAGVVGPDNYEFGWLRRHPEFHDVPCADVHLTGENFTSENPLTEEPGDQATTGAYSPFGAATDPGQVIPGEVPCSGAILRVRPEGGAVELVAWGLRNPFGLAFSPDGRLYVTENGFDQRGSRPVFGAGDALWAIEPGTWYGWPDFAQGRPVSGDEFAQGGNPRLRPLLAEHPGEPPKPAAVFGVHSSANGFDISRSPEFGHVGELFVAHFGDMAPGVGKVLGPVGFKVSRVDPETGRVEDFAVNRRDKGPASRVGGGGLERPVAARFDLSGGALYVVDFGVMTVDQRGPKPHAETGVLWRITRDGAPAARSSR